MVIFFHQVSVRLCFSVQETIGNNLGSLNNVLRVARTGNLTKAGECTLEQLGVYVRVHLQGNTSV